MPVPGLEVLADSWYSTIYHHPSDENKVIKVMDKKRAEAMFNRERTVYERLARPDRPSSILRYFEPDDTLKYALILEFAVEGDLYSYLWHTKDEISKATKCRWMHQASESLSYLHSLDIIHCDIHACNFLIHEHMNLKLCDFGAASVDGSRSLALYRPSHQLWLRGEDGEWEKEVSVLSELFALGCVFYHVDTRHGLFTVNGRDIEDDEMVRKLREREFPEIGEDLVLSNIIRKCWTMKYASMTDIKEDIPSEEYVTQHTRACIDTKTSK